MSSFPKARHALLLLLVAFSILVMVVVGRHSTPQQLMTLAPVVDRGTELLKAADQVGLAVVRLAPGETERLDEAIEAELLEGAPPPSAELRRDQPYVEGILARLDASSRIDPKPRIRVIDHPLPNAFALPGGTILVTTEMIELCENEAELASVVAHEMGHHELGHPMARLQYERVARKMGGPLLGDLSSLGYTLFSRGYSARDEEEADRQGLSIAARAGYHPQGAERLMTRLQIRSGDSGSTPSGIVTESAGAARAALRDYVATHPPFPERIRKLERARTELGLSVDDRSWFVGTRNHAERIPAQQRQEAADFRRGPLP